MGCIGVVIEILLPYYEFFNVIRNLFPGGISRTCKGPSLMDQASHRVVCTRGQCIQQKATKLNPQLAYITSDATGAPFSVANAWVTHAISFGFQPRFPLAVITHGRNGGVYGY